MKQKDFKNRIKEMTRMNIFKELGVSIETQIFKKETEVPSTSTDSNDLSWVSDQIAILEKSVDTCIANMQSILTVTSFKYLAFFS